MRSGAAAQGHQLDVGRVRARRRIRWATRSASSRVGQSTSACTASRLTSSLASRPRPKAAVLPLPVFAWRSNLCRRAPGAGSGLDRGHLQIAQAGEVVCRAGERFRLLNSLLFTKRTLASENQKWGGAQGAHHTRMCRRMR